MAPQASIPTERSPLLTKPRDEEEQRPTGAEEYEEPAVAGAGVEGWSEEAVRARRFSGPEGWPQDVGARRRLSSNAPPKPYEGMPEVRKRMIYIMPALAVGVSYIYQDSVFWPRLIEHQVFLSAADQTIIVSSYGQIGSDLNALSRTSWIATAYFLTLTSFQPLYGKLSDIFSRKSCLLVAYIIFGLGTLFCGLAQNINQLIAARAFAGIGGGGMTTVVSILLSDVIPLKERGTWQVSHKSIVIRMER